VEGRACRAARIAGLFGVEPQRIEELANSDFPGGEQGRRRIAPDQPSSLGVYRQPGSRPRSPGGAHASADTSSVIRSRGSLTLKLEGCEKSKVALAMLCRSV
jgi:hypothetical protein